MSESLTTAEMLKLLLQKSDEQAHALQELHDELSGRLHANEIRAERQQSQLDAHDVRFTSLTLLQTKGGEDILALQRAVANPDRTKHLEPHELSRLRTQWQEQGEVKIARLGSVHSAYVPATIALVGVIYTILHAHGLV